MAARTSHLPHDSSLPPVNLRYSIAPRVLDNSLPTASIVSNPRFSVRVAAQQDLHIPSTSNVLTTFIWRQDAASVFLAGSFDGWRKHQMLFVPDVNLHILVTELPPGNYTYRFVVNGSWRIDSSDTNVKRDQFGHLCHSISIEPGMQTSQSSQMNRCSSAAVSHALLSTNEEPVTDHGQSDTESERSADEDAQSALESPPVPRKRGDSTYIADYDDDAYAGLDLQADVFEAIKDGVEVNSNPRPRDSSPSCSRSTIHDSSSNRRVRRRPGVRMLRKVWAVLFGESAVDENLPPPDPVSLDRTATPTHNQKVHGLVTHENALKKGLKVWFPNERNFPAKTSHGRKVEPSETRDVIDAGDRALRLHQVEENANNRQMLGKNLFAQGKYDAALALFSLSVKLREENGLKYAKTTAIAHTDVASAFIHLDDMKNATKHLTMALAVFNKGTFSGGKAQLGDVHCFLGVVGDMRGHLSKAEKSYRSAIDLYEKCNATDDNPNYATAIENLNANLRRQRTCGPVASIDPPARKDGNELSSFTDPSSASRGDRVFPSKKHKGSVEKSPSSCTAAVSGNSRSSPVAMKHSKKHSHQPKLCVQKSEVRSGMGEAKAKAPSPLDASRPVPDLELSEVRQEHEAESQELTPPQCSERPVTWKGLADTARASMPHSPPMEEMPPEGDAEPPTGSYEEMCRVWHEDARNLLGEAKYKEAIDLYTLAIYTRKRHGPWNTRENAETLVEYARALLATRELSDSVGMLKDAIGILEKMNKKSDQIRLGEVWGNLGSVLDRMAKFRDDALTAHSAGMVVYGKAGMSSDDAKWTKAWKGLCVHLKMTGRLEQMEEMWRSIDMQIRGVIPVSNSSNVVLHR